MNQPRRAWRHRFPNCPRDCLLMGSLTRTPKGAERQQTKVDVENFLFLLEQGYRVPAACRRLQIKSARLLHALKGHPSLSASTIDALWTECKRERDLEAAR